MSAKLTASPRCRFCQAALTETFVDLGATPLCQTHIEPAQLNAMEPTYPLHAWVCGECFLVQLEAYVSSAEIFGDYAYFSSYSDSWVEHARRYAGQMRERFDLNTSSRVVEIASNDGYLLQHFVAAGIPVLGIEPAANVAAVARERGIPTEVCFHGVASAERLVAQHGKADLLLGNNVLAHTPELNDFVAGMQRLLAPGGVITMEFPHLAQLMLHNQFDTIYHEHFSYFSLLTVQRVFAAQGLALFDVEELPTHGGSLRIYANHTGVRPLSDRLQALLARERAEGFESLVKYRAFGEQVKATKRALLSLLIALKEQGARIAGYGAPGKGNTLLNYCGIGTDFLDYTVDRSPHKQGRFTPGSRIPIHAPEHLIENRPDYVLILPWNLTDEIVGQLPEVRAWGGRFIVPIPEPQILD
jgi:SAM-dependent methyltransferase